MRIRATATGDFIKNARRVSAPLRIGNICQPLLRINSNARFVPRSIDVPFHYKRGIRARRRPNNVTCFTHYARLHAPLRRGSITRPEQGQSVGILRFSGFGASFHLERFSGRLELPDWNAGKIPSRTPDIPGIPRFDDTGVLIELLIAGLRFARRLLRLRVSRTKPVAIRFNWLGRVIDGDATSRREYVDRAVCSILFC